MSNEANETSVATTGNGFSLIPPYAEMSDEIKAEIEEELEDFDDTKIIDYRRIKLPSGKSKAFEVESDDENDPDMEKVIKGVILFTHKVNVRWEGDFDGENKMPTCSSWDAKQGVVFETGECINCETCPYNQFKEDGTGKDCKNTRRIYLMKDGDSHLYLLTVPPTSLKAINKQLKKLLTSGSPLTRTIVEFKLESAQSKSGIDYAKVTVEKTGTLTDEQAAIAKAMREEIKSQYQNIGISNEDYGTQSADQPKVDENGFVDVTADNLEDAGLPFN